MARRKIEIDPHWLSYEAPPWVETVRRPADYDDRDYWEEMKISWKALQRATEYTGNTKEVFEVLGNFPVRDLLGTISRTKRGAKRKVSGWKRETFGALHAQRHYPDFSKRTIVKWLDTLPEGSLGYEYAKYQAFMKLDDFWQVMEPDYDPEQLGMYIAYRYFRLHDFLHWFLGFEPYDPVGETEIEAFIFAQSRQPNNLLFILGYTLFLLRNQPDMVPELLSADWKAYRYGLRAANVMLVDWDRYLRRPLEEVRAELRVNERPVAETLPLPKTPPKLAHVVLNVNDVGKAERYFHKLFGYTTSVRDEPLGLVALTDGTDHHTLALQQALPDNPVDLVLSSPQLLRRARALLKPRSKGVKSDRSGRAVSRPPLSVIRRGMGRGIHHLGFRVQSEKDLRAYYRMLRSRGVKVEWACNHADATKSLYIKLPNGVLAELFVDTEIVLKELARAKREGRSPVPQGVSTLTYELRIPEDL